MKKNHILIALVLLGTLLLTGCGARARVGTLQTESQSVELGDAESVVVEITFGAGDLEVTSGAQKLLDADFIYNVAKLKPEVEYSNGTLAVRQPDARGLPALQGITGYRNEWRLRLSDSVPMDLSVDMGAGSSDLHLAGLPLTRLKVNLGAGISTVDLSGDWARDLDVSIETGAADITVRLPSEVGIRVVVEAGPHTIETTGLTKDGNVYTNAAYGMSEVTLQVAVESGIGQIHLEVDESPAASD
jgi:N-terminal domain of toast_rack, DUF2154